MYPSIYTAMVETGEKSGKLRETFEIFANQMQADYELIRKVRGALMYPAVIIVVMIIIGVLMLIYVVPTLAETFEELNVDLPTSTQIVITLADFAINYTFYMIFGVITFIILFIRFIKTKIGKKLIDTIVLKIPLLSRLVKQFNAARTARTLNSLLASGVQVLEALDVTSRVVQNHHYQKVLLDAKKNCRKGRNYC